MQVTKSQLWVLGAGQYFYLGNGKIRTATFLPDPSLITEPVKTA
jgi:hypothetical protein